MAAAECIRAIDPETGDLPSLLAQLLTTAIAIPEEVEASEAVYLSQRLLPLIVRSDDRHGLPPESRKALASLLREFGIEVPFWLENPASAV